MPYNAPEWRGERYCLGCHTVTGGVGEDGFCPACTAEWERKQMVDAAEIEAAIVAAKLLMPGLSDRQIRRMLKKGKFIA